MIANAQRKRTSVSIACYTSLAGNHPVSFPSHSTCRCGRAMVPMAWCWQRTHQPPPAEQLLSLAAPKDRTVTLAMHKRKGNHALASA